GHRRRRRPPACAGCGRSHTKILYGRARPGKLMHPFDVLGDPVRRRILELLAEREHSSGEVVAGIAAEYGDSQAAVGQHLRAVHDAGFAQVRPEGTRRVYALDATPLRDIDDWLERFRVFWPVKLAALATEIARGKKARGEP